MLKALQPQYFFAMHKGRAIKFKAEHYKFTVWNILQRIEALGSYHHGEVVLTRFSSLKDVIKAAKWMEEMAIRQYDMARGK